MTELRRNRAKHKLAAGEAVNVLGGTALTADLIDFFGPLGFDAFWLEGEHGPIAYGDIPGLSRACDLWGACSIARVNRNVRGVIYRTLDNGAQGIVVPQVNTRAQAEGVVEASKFHPLGKRGFFPSRQGHGVADFYAKANDETLVVVLIEDVEAIENLPQILEVDHIDAFCVVPGDLSQSMGVMVEPPVPEVVAVMDQALADIVASGRVAGTAVDTRTVGKYLEMGVRFLYTEWNEWAVEGAQRYLGQVAAATA